MKDRTSTNENQAGLDQIVGTAVKNHRSLAGLTLAELSKQSSVSTAMISKIERGQVSASLSTLDALAKSIGVPLINFFAGTVERSDVSYVAAGEGVTVQRLGSGYGHSYKLIGRADASQVSFESFRVTLEAPLTPTPLYQHSGIEFIHVVDGSMVYRCGDTTYPMGPGDSMSFDSNAAHGPVALNSKTVTFIAVMARAVSRDV